MANSDREDLRENTGDKIADTDIVFECRHCGKSFVIDAAGAGVIIQCPECENEIQIPIPGQDDEDEPRTTEIPDDHEAREEALSRDLAELSRDNARLRDENRNLKTELEEMRFRRRYLEKARSEHIKLMQNLGKQVAMLRTAIDQLADFLKTPQAESDDTQEIG